MRLLLYFVFAQFAAGEAFVVVSSANPRYLELSDGRPFVPIGLNIGWERHATDEAEVFTRTEARFRKLAANGGNFARIWLSHPFYAVDPEAPRNQIELKLRRIDRLVRIAKRHGIRLKLCLEHFRTLDKEPPRFAGSVSMGHPGYAGLPQTITEFFSHKREWFLKKLDILAEHYANEPVIFGWELWNEINAVKGSGWEEWTRAMLPELKRRFPRQLAMQTLGSFDRPESTELYRRFSAMPGNEMAQVHRYLDLGAKLDVCRGPFDVLAASAVSSGLSFTANRPVLLSELGAVEPNHAGPFKLYAKDREGLLLHDGLFAPFFAGAAGPGQFWHWQDYVEPNELWRHFARFAEAIRGIDPRAEGFEPSILPHDQLRVYALRGKRHTLIWVRDASSDWRSELGEGKPAQELKGLTLQVPGARADVYDPWTGRHTTVELRDGKFTLPAFRRSLVLRIEAPRG